MAVGIGLIIGTLSTFRWLFKAASETTIGWWDAASFVCMGPLIRRAVTYIASRFDGIPSWIPTAFSLAISVAVMYWMLRGWKELTPRQAAIVSFAWIPIAIVSVLLFMLANPQYFAQKN